MSYEWFVSRRYLAAKRKQTFISLITWISIGGVAVGVTALITVLAVMTGAQEDLRDKILGANAHIIITHVSGNGTGDAEAIAREVTRIPGVSGASPFIFNQVMLASATRVTGVAIRGVQVDPPSTSSDIGRYLEEGMLSHLAGKYARVGKEEDDLGATVEIRRAGIAIGAELAHLLQIRLGDPLTVVSPVGGTVTPTGTTPISRPFFVAAIFSTGMYEYDSSLALIDLDEARSLFSMEDRATGVEVKVDDIHNAPAIAESIDTVIGFPHVARDWRTLNRNLFFALQLEKTALGIILTLIIGVAAFNIVSTLIMVVMEKTRDIAILKAMGASSRSVLKIFFLEGAVIGVTGTLLGDVGAVGLCEILKRYRIIELPADVYNLDTLPVRLEFGDMALVSAVAIFITLLATLYPAWSASRLDPSEALRYE
ncbi:MAG: lipoprotein-releasing ABC transporter permease subunit [Nitrospinae bacterium]|nr:lipoprotein-releasing ABC transporter permease subunit [Nitrospinota bacterium]